MLCAQDGQGSNKHTRGEHIYLFCLLMFITCSLLLGTCLLCSCKKKEEKSQLPDYLWAAFPYFESGKAMVKPQMV